jgi:hypothetical protein
MCIGYNTARRARWAWRPLWRVFGCIVSDTAVYRYRYGLSYAILAVQFWQCHFGGRPAILAVYPKSYSVCNFVHVCETIQGVYARAYLHLLLLPVISVRVHARVRGITGL